MAKPKKAICSCCQQEKNYNDLVVPERIINTRINWESDNFLEILLPKIKGVEYFSWLFCPDCVLELKKVMGDSITNLLNYHADIKEQEEEERKQKFLPKFQKPKQIKEEVIYTMTDQEFLNNYIA